MQIKLRKIFILIVLMLPIVVYASANQLLNISIDKSDQSHLRVLLNLAKAADYQTLKLRNPSRLVINIDNTDNVARFAQTQLSNTPIQKIRFGKQKENTLRVVFDLAMPVTSTISTVTTSSKYGEQILVDLSTNDKVAVRPATHAPSKPVLQTNLTPGNRDVVVVIDPGHGGKDPGASGPHGVYEKDIVLAISKELCQLINAQPGMKAVLTRRGDYYIGLRERLGIARKNKADVFVAVHADAYQDPFSRGASVYALSVRGASSEAARWLAAKENNSELGGVSLNDKGDMLRSVLIDLSQTATISSSLLLGNDVLSNIGMFSPLHYKQVEQAAFVVLKSPDIPSVLIETGFISNPDNERQLNDPLYQKKLAQAIFQGIDGYFYQRPPAGSLLAAKIQATRLS